MAEGASSARGKDVVDVVIAVDGVVAVAVDAVVPVSADAALVLRVVFDDVDFGADFDVDFDVDTMFGPALFVGFPVVGPMFSRSVNSSSLN